MTNEVKEKLLCGTIGLRNPPWRSMDNEARLLHACLCAYRKHVQMDENIGWDELGDTLHNAICNTIGDDEFVAWNEGTFDS